MLTISHIGLATHGGGCRAISKSMKGNLAMPHAPAGKMRPLYPFGLAFLCFALPLYADFTTWFVGFPDGHITELENAEGTLVTWFLRVSLPMGLWFICLGIAAFRHPVRNRVRYSFALYLALLAAAIALDLHFQATLDDGVGG